MQNKNTIKNWKIEITEEGAKLFITEGAVMARDVLNLAREQAIKYNLSVLKIYMHDGQYYDYTFEDDMLYFIHMTEKIENEDISYLMKRAAEKLSTLKLDDRIWSVNFSIDNLPREKNGDLYAACAMVIHFYDRNDDYEIDSQRFYFNLSSGQWESIKNVKNKSISCKNSLACKIGDNYFMIQKSEDGYDYTLYTSDYSEIDGGQLDNPDISIYDAMNEILEDLDIEIPGHKDEIDYEELEEKVENAENERINKMLSKHGCTVIAQSDQHTDFLIKSGEILKKVLEIAQNNQLIRTDDSIEDYGEYFYIVFDCSSWKYQIQRYTELFKNVYSPEIENPKDGMEKEREVIKTLIKEGLGMLNKARSQALFLDDIEMQEDITNALNIFLAAEEKQQKISPEKNLFEDYTDEELLIFYDCLKKADFYVIPELSKIASKYVSSKRCYLDLIFELSKRWYQEKQKKYKEENGKFHQWLEGEDPLI